MSTTTFTAFHIKAFKVYEKVRKAGRYNMFDPSARYATGLDRDTYLFVMRNYEALSELAGKETKHE